MDMVEYKGAIFLFAKPVPIGDSKSHKAFEGYTDDSWLRHFDDGIEPLSPFDNKTSTRLKTVGVISTVPYEGTVNDEKILICPLKPGIEDLPGTSRFRGRYFFPKAEAVIGIGTAGGNCPDLAYGNVVIPRKSENNIAARMNGVLESDELIGFSNARLSQYIADSLRARNIGFIDKVRSYSAMADKWKEGSEEVNWKPEEARHVDEAQKRRDAWANGYYATEMESAVFLSTANRVSTPAATALVITDIKDDIPLGPKIKQPCNDPENILLMQKSWFTALDEAIQVMTEFKA